jgi:hypothetical protein
MSGVRHDDARGDNVRILTALAIASICSAMLQDAWRFEHSETYGN